MSLRRENDIPAGIFGLINRGKTQETIGQFKNNKNRQIYAKNFRNSSGFFYLFRENWAYIQIPLFDSCDRSVIDRFFFEFPISPSEVNRFINRLCLPVRTPIRTMECTNIAEYSHLFSRCFSIKHHRSKPIELGINVIEVINDLKWIFPKNKIPEFSYGFGSKKVDIILQDHYSDDKFTIVSELGRLIFQSKRLFGYVPWNNPIMALFSNIIKRHNATAESNLLSELGLFQQLCYRKKISQPNIHTCEKFPYIKEFIDVNIKSSNSKILFIKIIQKIDFSQIYMELLKLFPSIAIRKPLLTWKMIALSKRKINVDYHSMPMKARKLKKIFIIKKKKIRFIQRSLF